MTRIRQISTELSQNGTRYPPHVPGFNRDETQAFDIPLVLTGTPFQHQVWTTLRTIPYGKTRSYKEQAEMIGRPSAVRAVARANGDNRMAIIIPCHRVIGVDGHLTGYGGGLWRKRYTYNGHKRAFLGTRMNADERGFFRIFCSNLCLSVKSVSYSCNFIMCFYRRVEYICSLWRLEPLFFHRDIKIIVRIGV